MENHQHHQTVHLECSRAPAASVAVAVLVGLVVAVLARVVERLVLEPPPPTSSHPIVPVNRLALT